MRPKPGFHIATVAAIPIYLHPTWLVIFGLITWTLVNQYSTQHPEWSAQQHWGAGVVTSILFFGSVILHEIAHGLVSRHYKIKVQEITLYIFGGVTRSEREPTRAIQEFNIAAAGPLANILLYVIFHTLTKFFSYNNTIGALTSWLAFINISLAVFNLLPGFPLDGGRLFRAIAWGITGDFSRATRIAGAIGKLVAYSIILSGAWLALAGGITIGTWFNLERNFVTGLWTAFIGWFILNAAQESVAQIEVRENLSGLRAQDVMSHDVPTFPGGNTLEDYAEEVLRTGRRFHLVLSNDRLTGIMNVHALNSVPRDEWDSTSVQGVMVPRENILWAKPDEPLLGLLERLLTSDVNQMPVVSDGEEEGNLQIIGMVTRDSILRVIQTRSELGTATLRANKD